MLVSFLVPVYNVEIYLKECIDSILVQKGCDYEIILLDDGSTDRSGVICDFYKDRYPELIRVIHKENEGLLATRRRGFKEAKGDWFICVDSDDLVKTNLLETIVSIIQEVDCDMVMYNYEYLELNGNMTKSRVSFPSDQVFDKETKPLIYEKMLCSSDINSMCMRAMRCDIVDIDEDYSQCGIRNMCEDAVQMLSIYTNAKRIVYTDKALYLYRKGQESITANITIDRWDAIYKCACITESYLDKWDVSMDTRKNFYTRNLESICDYLRWVFNSQQKDLRISKRKVLELLSNSSLFCSCVEHYSQDFARSNYLKIIIPHIVKCIAANNVILLKYFFLLERLLLRLKKKRKLKKQK